MRLSNNQRAFFALVKAGLWEQDVQLAQFDKIDYSEVLRLAEEQSVAGLVAAGLEHVTDVRVPKEDVLHFVGRTLQMEQRNLAMNAFIAKLTDDMRSKDIYAVLVKGQGVAQCYERPLWRACGDVDLLLATDAYERAKQLLLPLAVDMEDEYKSFKHIGMTMQGGFVVELHGTLHSRLSKRVDKVIDAVQNDVFLNCSVRSWQNSEVVVPLPAPDNDILLVFTHILNHFFLEGVGLRQICDWCRLLWTFRKVINVKQIEQWICEAGLMIEWRTFASMAVDWLGMPVEAMPFYDSKYSDKGEKILEFVLDTGNFGHNRRTVSSGSFIGDKAKSFWRKAKDFACHIRVFPVNVIRFFPHFAINGLKEATSKILCGTHI